MKRFFTWISTVSIFVSVFAAGNAFATNGYFTHGIGTKNKAMAGAGTAMPEDAIDIANNPASAALVGNHMVAGAALFSPNRKYQTTQSQINGQFNAFTIGPNEIKSDSDFFIIPHFARTWQLNNGHAFGIAFYGRGGMNTNWKGGTATFDPDGPRPAPVTTFPGTFGAGDAGVNLAQGFLDITWAKKLNDNVSLGIAPVLAVQMFRARGVMSFAGFTESFAASGGMALPQNLSDNGTDFAFGAGLKVGLNAALSDALNVALSYQTKIYMGEFDDYADLFAQDGGFDIPASIKFGVTLHANENLAVSFDIDHTWYSEIDSVGNSIVNIFACPTAGQGGTDLSSCLGGENGAGFGWDDVTTFKAGLAWKVSDELTWRAGYNFGKQPIPTSEITFNILAPATPESHITTGFTWSKTRNRELNVSLMFAPNKKVSGTQNFDPTQSVTLEMSQWELEASYSWRY